MFIDVKTFFFDSLVYTQAVQLLDAIEQDETAGGSPKVDDQDTETLGAEESPAVTIESAVRCRQQTRHQCAENTADTMHTRSTDRVVDMQTVVDELDGIDQHQSTDKANDDGSYR